MGRTWLAALTKKLWLVAWDMWDDRNGDLHGKEATAEQKQQHDLLNKRIQNQFNKGIEGLPRHTVNLMSKDGPEEVKKKTKSQKISWLNMVAKLRLKTNSPNIDQQRRFMERWLMEQCN